MSTFNNMEPKNASEEKDLPPESSFNEKQDVSKDYVKTQEKDNVDTMPDTEPKRNQGFDQTQVQEDTQAQVEEPIQDQRQVPPPPPYSQEQTPFDHQQAQTQAQQPYDQQQVHAHVQQPYAQQPYDQQQAQTQQPHAGQGQTYQQPYVGQGQTYQQPHAGQGQTYQQPHVGQSQDYQQPYVQQPYVNQEQGYQQQGYQQQGYQQQGYQQQGPYHYQQPVASKDHIAAGLLGIFLGALGIHKFYLGYNTPGFIMLAVTVLGSVLTFGIAGAAVGVIGIIEGILYLTKSQGDFESTYVFNKREWF